MRLIRTAALAVVVCALAGCGGGGKPEPGHADAAAACQGGGQQAAALAVKAAAANSRFATLAVDEKALAANESTQETELSDGTSSDDNNLGSLAGSVDFGSAAGQKVLNDCLELGLQVTNK